MKFFMMFALCMVAVSAELDPELKKQMVEVFMAITTDCVAQENSNFADVINLLNNKMPTTRTAKCLLSCYFQHTYLQTPGGKMSIEGITAAVEFFKDNQYLYEAMGEIGKICIAETESLTDRCDVAGKFAECTTRITQEIGLLDGPMFK